MQGPSTCGWDMLLLLTTALVGCSPDEPAQPAAPTTVHVAASNELATAILPDMMDLLVDPAAGVLFAAADQPARADAEPRSAEAWQAVADAANELARLSESLTQPALASDRDDWRQWNAAMKEGASRAAAAARRHDPRSLFAAGVQVRASCQACHARYAPSSDALKPLTPRDAKPPGS